MEVFEKIKATFELQSAHENILTLRNSSYKERIKKIKSILNYILDDSNHKIIADAIYKELRKPNEEVITISS